MSAETYQVGAHFKALNESVLMAPSKIIDIFFHLESHTCPVGGYDSLVPKHSPYNAMPIVGNTLLTNPKNM